MDTATTEIYTLSLHDALPIFEDHLGAAGLADPVALHGHDARGPVNRVQVAVQPVGVGGDAEEPLLQDRKSTRLNSSHSQISYAVFCLKKKKRNTLNIHQTS